MTTRRKMRVLYIGIAFLLCVVYAGIAPLCFASVNGGMHSGHGGTLAIAHHAEMYQSFVFALLVSAALLFVALLCAHISLAYAVSMVCFASMRVHAHCRDPMVGHRNHFLRYVTRLVHAPPTADL